MKTRVVHVNDQVPGAVYIGRAMPRRGLKAFPLANPFKISDFGSRAVVIHLYREKLRKSAYGGDYLDGVYTEPEFVKAILGHLVGKPLACWCRHDGEERTEETTCHGDVLIEIIRELGLEPDS